MGLFDDTHVPIKVETAIGYNAPGPDNLPFTGIRLSLTWREKMVGEVRENYLLTEQGALVLLAALGRGLVEISNLREQ